MHVGAWTYLRTDTLLMRFFKEHADLDIQQIIVEIKSSQNVLIA